MSISRGPFLEANQKIKPTRTCAASDVYICGWKTLLIFWCGFHSIIICTSPSYLRSLSFFFLHSHARLGIVLKFCATNPSEHITVSRASENPLYVADLQSARL